MCRDCQRLVPSQLRWLRDKSSLPISVPFHLAAPATRAPSPQLGGPAKPVLGQEGAELSLDELLPEADSPHSLIPGLLVTGMVPPASPPARSWGSPGMLGHHRHQTPCAQ